MKRLHRNHKIHHGPESARGRSATRAELQEQRAGISEVLRGIAGSPQDLQPIFDTILDNATRLCGATLGTLLLFEGTGFRIVAHKGSRTFVRLLPKGSVHRILKGTPVDRLIRNKAAVHIADLKKEQSYIQRERGVVSSLVSAGGRTSLLVPMLTGDELIGAIGILRAKLNPFTDKQIELITDFAAQATIALEITRRERQYRDAQIALAHANRVATMGQLTASIAHEIKQPLAAAVMGGNTSLRWLAKQPPQIERAKRSLEFLIEDVNRIGDIIRQIHSLVKKDTPRRETFDVNEAILEVLALVHGEVVENGVSVQTQLAEHLPRFQGDRVQIQQVVLNLVINAIQAMRGPTEGKRELQISSAKTDSEGVRVGVRDSGPGLSVENLQHLFEAFYTTKPNGMGMGLLISRSIIEAQGGQLWVSGHESPGALFQFTIPAFPSENGHQ